MLRSIPFTGIPGLGDTLDKQSAIGTALHGQYFIVKLYPSTFSSILASLGGACAKFFSAINWSGLWSVFTVTLCLHI